MPAMDRRNAVAVTYEGSGYLRVTPRTESVQSTAGGNVAALRGKVREFSRKSRKRLLDLTSTLRRDDLPILVTLTYPGEFSGDSKVWKRDLDAFAKRLERSDWGPSYFVWKLEPQKRGAPHFHLLLWGIKASPSFREWLSQTWFEVVGSGDPRHLRAGTNAEWVRSHRGVMRYASKYLGKVIPGREVEGWDRPGRFWGERFKANRPRGRLLYVQLSQAAGYNLVRFIRRFTHGKVRLTRVRGSVTLYSNDPEQFLLAAARSTGDPLWFSAVP